ncbi:MAG TPA: ATP-binding protein [Actinomycetota bacterium]|nr:ATP-binding protein [Actinomycetota bacterium]
MRAPNSETWLAANQRGLMAEVAWIRQRLDGQVGEGPAGTSAALDLVCEQFGLTHFERAILVLTAAVELDGSFGEALARAQGDAARPVPTFGLALAALAEPHWSALAPWGALRHWRLVELGPGSLTTAALRIDEWLLHALVGAGGLDPRLAPSLRLLEPGTPLPSAKGAVDALCAAWLPDSGAAGGAPEKTGAGGPGATGAGGLPPRLACLCGRLEASRAVFAQACARLGWDAYALATADVPPGAGEREELVRLWEREALLRPAALLVEAGDAPSRAATESFLARLTVPAAVSGGDATVGGGRPVAVIDAPAATATEQRALWGAALAGDAAFASLNGALDRVVAHFDLDPCRIEAAAGRALGAQPGNGRGSEAGDDPAQRVWAACRRSARGGLDDLAERLETTACFDDLVLAAEQLDLLQDIAAQARHRTQVYEQWGMAGPSQRGLGINALFAGPSGTGKTLAAEVLANTLELDLYRIDLSQVVSKYIGETEKNLRRIFSAARGSGAVLLFDEADALFGKRSEVRDSHDRYANVEISYLLQAMESYRGLALLTTNMRQALDQAFLRRLRFVVSFPFPGPAERGRIWARAFPVQTPTQGLDLDRLARLSVAGGTIRSIALQAAFRAAATGVPVGMGEVLHATVAEYAKLERPLSEAEIGGWR